TAADGEGGEAPDDVLKVGAQTLNDTTTPAVAEGSKGSVEPADGSSDRHAGTSGKAAADGSAAADPSVTAVAASFLRVERRGALAAVRLGSFGVGVVVRGAATAADNGGLSDKGAAVREWWYEDEADGVAKKGGELAEAAAAAASVEVPGDAFMHVAAASTAAGGAKCWEPVAVSGLVQSAVAAKSGTLADVIGSGDAAGVVAFVGVAAKSMGLTTMATTAVAAGTVAAAAAAFASLGIHAPSAATRRRLAHRLLPSLLLPPPTASVAVAESAPLLDAHHEPPADGADADEGWEFAPSAVPASDATPAHDDVVLSGIPALPSIAPSPRLRPPPVAAIAVVGAMQAVAAAASTLAGVAAA
ncbi:hypothetical protein HK405_000493, partial [Cladochytrium tenue]